MFRKIPLALTAALTLALAIPAHADDSQNAAAKALVDTIHVEGMLPGLVQQATNTAAPLLQEYFVKNKIALAPEQQKKVQAGLKSYIERQHKLAADYFASPQVKQQLQASFIKVYAAQFSADELKQINAFYQTPAGQKLMAQQGQIVNVVANEMLQTAQKNLLPKMRAAAVDYGKTSAK